MLQAIQLSQKNVDIITANSNITPEELMDMVAEYDSTDLDTALIFIPNIETEDHPEGVWATIPMRSFYEYYDCPDSLKMCCELVDITHK